jgi:uncharacterized protein YndB with AHSA1/START domain
MVWLIRKNTMNDDSHKNFAEIKTSFILMLLILIVVLAPDQILLSVHDSVSIASNDGQKLYLTTGLVIRKEVILPATPDRIWQAWTTDKGVTGFFAPHASVDLAIGGKYEMYFDPKQPKGKQGSEGCRILSFVPREMLSFTWNAPPSMAGVRKKNTWVVVTFTELSPGKTRVSLVHLGWQAGPEWEKALIYFDRAWEIVLGRLHHYLQKGPMDWRSPYTPEINRSKPGSD